ncbi:MULTISPECIES: response regulator transcription factor [Oceanimonas]|uniref:DNA-binding response regulator n=1 Tax=Oceanimonas doudoroffii TaxID=84158 RepID=A0A233RIX0_9GAMM|nr:MULTISPECIES: response regulator transcription factor [Oceanimonas]NHI00078.1 Transcriptional regulatory protein DegU [Oceanimonas sp. MB9]OXY83323.1 DNA-binding response regulator [Oceanimonas doudoroffii]
MDTGYRIVIADDHPLFRSALHQAVRLAVSDAQLQEVDSIDSLLQLLEDSDEVDLLLLDLKMPGASGFSGLTRLRALYPALPVVVVSASEDAVVVQQAMRLGAVGFIPKSAPMPTLVSALNTVLEGDGWFPEGISLEDAPEDDMAERLASLTPQQFKVLTMLSEGKLNKQIAYELEVSEATIKAHVTAIFRKLDVKNRTQAVIALSQLTGGDF